MGPLLLAALGPPALAAELPELPALHEPHVLEDHGLRYGLSFGFEGVINDPFLNRHGARVGFGVAPAPWVEVGTALVYYPILGQGGENDPDWKPLAKQLLVHNSVSPDISKLVWQWQTVVRVQALRAPLGPGWEAGFGLLAGVTAVGTEDDLVALQNDSESAVATQSQVHVGPVVGGFWQAREDRFTLRVRFQFDTYIETVNSTTLEVKKNGILGAELIWWFG